MDTIEAPKPSKLLPRLTAALIFIFGIYITVSMSKGIWKAFNEGQAFTIALAVAVILTSAFLVYLFLLGIKVWANISTNHIRQISLIAAFFISAATISLLEPVDLDRIFAQYTISISWIIAGVSYFIICGLLLKLLKTPKTPIPGALEAVFRFYFILNALGIFNIITQTYMTFSDKKEEPYSLGIFLVFPIAIAIAMIFYKTCMRLTLKN